MNSNPRSRRAVAATLLGSVLLVAVACTGDDGAAPVTSAGGPRPVPTVPASTSPGQSGSVPTIVPVPPPSIDPNVPLTTQVPPTTDLVGDPQPDPEATLPPPPPPGDDLPALCDLLAVFEVAQAVGDELGTAVAQATADGDDICRFTAGNALVEVHRVPESDVVDDWYRREGIEPVGEVGGEAVAIPRFVPPGARSAEGYTIALVNGRQGLIIAARVASDARMLAATVAILAGQAV